MGILIDGKTIAKKILNKTSQKMAVLQQNGIIPQLGIILVGHNPASKIYVHKKIQKAKKIGIQTALFHLKETIDENSLIDKINQIQKNEPLSGLIVQLPLPVGFNTQAILDTIHPKIDIDCLTSTNLGKLATQTHCLTPPAAQAVMDVLAELKLNPSGKNVTIIGAGQLVGRPLSLMMINANATLTICNEQTQNLKTKCLDADIVISAVGKKNLITKDMISRNAVVIDVGTSIDNNGQLCGDVNTKDVLGKARYLTPTPGGIGPITVARLLWNTVVCAEYNIQK